MRSPYAKADQILDAFIEAHDSVPGHTREEFMLALMMFFDRIHEQTPEMMPIVISSWQSLRREKSN